MRRKNLLSLVLIAVMFVTLVLPEGLIVYAGGMPSYTFDVSQGDITISLDTGDNIKVTYGSGLIQNNITTGEQIIITGTTETYKVKVDGVTANIMLSNINIQFHIADSADNNKCAFELTGGANVTLTLLDGTNNTLQSGRNKAGLGVPDGQSLKIQGTGTLDAISVYSGAGIGGSIGETGGNITIAGGEIKATGGAYGAGIGGGDSGAGGTIRILNGNITAIGGLGSNGISTCGAGIGGGKNGSGGNISIEGGTVTAIGGGNAAGIGGGQFKDGGIINITGGDVTATGGDCAAAIGGGYGKTDQTTTGGVITIDNPSGKVIAIGGAMGGAGIGGGLLSSGGMITIKQGIVEATGGSKSASNVGSGGAGIGGGCIGAGGIIQILGGEVTATGGRDGGAGMGGGDSGAGGDITIDGESAKVTATGGQNGGAGIGSGRNRAGGTISLLKGEVTAIGGSGASGSGAGIGGGASGAGGDITIKPSVTLRAASNGIKAAIDIAGASANQIETGVLIANLPSVQSANTTASVYSIDSSETLYTMSFAPAQDYKSIAFAVPLNNTYQLKIGDALQMNAGTPDFVLGGEGLNIFSGVATVPESDKGALTDRDALTEGVIKGGNIDLSHVISPLALLPAHGENGSAITWQSEKTAVLSHDGQTVIRPAQGENNANVLLTATIKKGSVTVTKVFSVTVLAERDSPDILKAAADKAALTEATIKGINIDLAHITGRLTNPLPSVGTVNGSVITWSSSVPSVISNDGQTVVRPAYGVANVQVILTATIKKGTTSETKDFVLTVLANPAPSSGGETGGGNNSSISMPESAEQVINQLNNNDREVILKNFKELMPYTRLSIGLTFKQLKQFTNNKFTDKQLQELLDKPELLKKLGVDESMLSQPIVLNPVKNTSFTDVQPTHWANGSIKAAAELGLAAGMPDGSFAPSVPLQAADAFTFLDRVLLLHGKTEMKLSRSTVEKHITDKSHWAFFSMASIGSKLSEETLKAVSRLGDKPLSRELLAQVLYEITEGKLGSVREEMTFEDIADSPYNKAINYCIRVGLFNGTDSKHMNAEKALTRAELMTILIRLNEKLK